MEKTLLNANLLKKYHTNLVYDYTEYPTKGNWNGNFKHKDYEKSLESINSEMKKQCNKENTFFIDIDSNNFEFTNDFYDTVHMLPSGNRKLSNIIFKEMIDLKIDDKL